MKNRRDVDLRGFHWPLAALERKSAHELDTTSMRLAQTRRELHLAQEELRRMREASAALERALAVTLRFDAQLRLAALRYLADAQEQLRRGSEQASALGSRVDSATAACLAADRRLSSVRDLREAALQRLAAQQGRRSAREADLAWLAALSGRRPRQRHGEEA